MEGTGAGIYGQSVGRRLSISLGRYAIVFKAKIHAILDDVMKFKQMVDQRNTLSICSDIQVALKALQTAKTSPLVRVPKDE